MISAFKQSPPHTIHGIKCFTFWCHVHQVGTWIYLVQMHIWKVPRCLYKAALKTYHLPLTRSILPFCFVRHLFFMAPLFLEVFFLSPCLLGFPRIFFADRLFFVPPLLPEAIFLFRCFLDFRVSFADCQKREIKDKGEKPPEKSDWLHHHIWTHVGSGSVLSTELSFEA